MPAVSRKQRDFQQRELLILDCAQQMLHQHGYAHLTMERIAAKVEYSKGTIYNHFCSKEDLVCSLCCRCVSSLIELFERAYDYSGSTRERFSAIGIGYTLYHQLHPMDSENIQIVKTHAVREKLSDKKLDELQQLEQQIIALTIKLVEEAIACGDLAATSKTMADNIVFGCWSMHYGSMLLQNSDIPLNELGFSPVLEMTWLNSQKLMDGFGWLPLSTELDSDTGFNKLMNELFAEEIALLKKTG
jgi:AcrR family transcriptional regulator